MTTSEIIGIFQAAMLTTMKLALPILIVSVLVGLVISVFQAATQIHEQTLSLYQSFWQLRQCFFYWGRG